MSGLKNDKNKPDFTLIPIEVLESMERVLAYGVKKYSRDNWQLVKPSKYISAMWRHFLAFCKDNNSRDDESDLLHIEHVLVNAMFLVWFVKNKKLPIENENWQNEKFNLREYNKSVIVNAYKNKQKISFVLNNKVYNNIEVMLSKSKIYYIIVDKREIVLPFDKIKIIEDEVVEIKAVSKYDKTIVRAKEILAAAYADNRLNVTFVLLDGTKFASVKVRWIGQISFKIMGSNREFFIDNLRSIENEDVNNQNRLLRLMKEIHSEDLECYISLFDKDGRFIKCSILKIMEYSNKIKIMKSSNNEKLYVNFRNIKDVRLYL